MSKDTQLNVNEIGSTETQRGYFIPNKKNSVFVLESRTELYKLFLTETGDLYSFNEFGHEFLQLFLDKNTIFSIEKKKRFYQKKIPQAVNLFVPGVIQTQKHTTGIAKCRSQTTIKVRQS